jgi:tRNA pseudouridine38-40 synthase
MRVALRLAYEGSSLWGFARQPGKPTVEGILLEALKRSGLVEGPKQARYEAAARTDRGVGALGQVVAFDSTRDSTEEELNSLLPPELTVLAAVEVPTAFSPRREALFRHYRYVLPLPEPFDLREARRGARLLETASDFSPFCRPEPGKPSFCKLFLVGVRAEGGILKADFVATHFLHQQVRRMMGALLLLGQGKMELEELWSLTRKGGRMRGEPAPAEGLFLVGVGYRGMAFPPSAGAVERFARELGRRPGWRSLEMLRMLREEFEDINKGKEGNFRIWRGTSQG